MKKTQKLRIGKKIKNNLNMKIQTLDDSKEIFQIRATQLEKCFRGLQMVKVKLDYFCLRRYIGVGKGRL